VPCKEKVENYNFLGYRLFEISD